MAVWIVRGRDVSMNRTALIFGACAMPLAACAPTGEAEGAPATRPPERTCDAAPAQGLVGQKATSEVGQRMLELTGARVLRWVPPRTAVTMDYRYDRLTVSYDDDMIIERISCG
jgi:hypothetical protein